ncbi:3,4-dihydroxy-2-butanone-4-phosphate synthase [Aureimonas jatrophae]|uniref:3,4-dihydroxy-2-butanone 4-phosphate synthase n=1 Tax=Aureimonas jatrophae TaxID=1166073 RepID=A0A1H0GQN9_9HYPH|nr:3,4-dihydroxy-2-butanone-4-phosphate synthase [Aureimonas jatrophae]MBB3949708.1 3,4-dihydroxy 2-butanone 4-phosphate synthase/GTP cyclohydrolase II [Aureimonas jatrophae]SDO09160.1 3,4-dihydroxy 2-butanone 4-phosphate synthase / GTP cyclohydrolase II [Aureimonas jatrophae]
MELNKVEDAIAAIAAGELVVVVDDTDRENEGDLIMAASKATPEKIAFMIRHTSGILCVPMTAERAERLNLPPMVANNLDPMRTAFTVSVDYRVGMTTGISSEERANTARALVNDNVAPSDFIRPGHMFPLIAREGGVLTRSGHTEAGVDLARLAGLPPAGILAEIVNDDGTVKRLGELIPFAKEHGLKIVSIEDMISYRIRRESFVRRVRDDAVTIAGLPARVLVYQTPFDDVQHVVAVFGDVRTAEHVPVRIYREQPVEELLRKSGARSWVDIATDHIRTKGRGILMLLRNAQIDDFDPAQLATNVNAAGVADGEQHGSAKVRSQRWREVGVGAQILRDLDVRSIDVLTSQERGYVGLTGFGIEIAGTTLLRE